jgi:splicing factor 3A subunit 1
MDLIKEQTEVKDKNINNNIDILGEGIAMIYPPPETKKVIDKAATLVAQYGIQVETSMKEDPNFSFINKTDSYYPYYQKKISEAKEELKKNLEEICTKKNNEFLNKKRKEDNIELEKETKVLLKEAMQDKINLLKNIKTSEQDQEKKIQPISQPQFSVPTPNISGTELDIIKISAQFVAKNGQKFLSDLIRREKDNPQFDFMKPQHTLFGFFTFLVGCYAKILNNKNEIMTKIEKYATNGDEILKAGNQIYLYEKKMSKIPRGKRFSQEDLLSGEEKEKMKQIDWYDFVLVETIDFSDEEEQKDDNSYNEGNHNIISKKENLYNNNYNNITNYENNLNNITSIEEETTTINTNNINNNNLINNEKKI